MKLKLEHLGRLVRPRIITMAKVVPYPPASDFFTAKESFSPVQQFNKKPEFIFSELNLGDTTVSLHDCYVAKITHYLIELGNCFLIVDQSNGLETLRLAKKKFGSRTNLRVVSVGVEFYKGMEKDQAGLRAINKWEPKNSDNQKFIWFYRPCDLVFIEEILKYEAANPGDLIIFQKTMNITIKKRKLNKPSFYSTSSWSTFSLILLNGTADGYTRFLPNRLFKIKPGKQTIKFLRLRKSIKEGLSSGVTEAFEEPDILTVDDL